MPNAPSTQQRDTIKRLSPPWLKDGNGEKFLYTIGLALDLLLEKQNQAQKLHMPGVGDPSALPFIGNDRLLVQGPAETSDQFALRCQGAFSSWQISGSRASVLADVQAYLTNLQPGVVAGTPEALIVGGNAAFATWDMVLNGQAQGSPPAHVQIPAGNPTGVWDWDSQTKPWRSWLVLFMQRVDTGFGGTAASVVSVGGSGLAGVTSGFATLTGLTGAGLSAANVGNWLQMVSTSHSGNSGYLQIVSVLSDTSCVIANPSAVVQTDGAITWELYAYPFIAPGLAWGSPGLLWGDTNRSWGLSCSSETLTSIRQIVQRWKSANTYYPHIVVSFGTQFTPGGEQDSFSPVTTTSVGNPNGSWGSYGKSLNGVWVPARTTFANLFCLCDGTGVYQNATVHTRT